VHVDVETVVECLAITI